MARATAQLMQVDDVADGIDAGAVLGLLERRYGLLCCDEKVTIVAVHDRVGDLAVADRLAFVRANRSHEQLAVVERQGWYYVVALDRHLSLSQALDLSPGEAALRLMSLAGERGLAPLVAPLVS